MELEDRRSIGGRGGKEDRKGRRMRGYRCADSWADRSIPLMKYIVKLREVDWKAREAAEEPPFEKVRSGR